MIFVKFIIFASVIAFTLAEVVDFQACSDANICEIKQLRVDPCPQAESHIACHLRRRKPVTMSVDFVPHFEADTLESKLVWVKNADQELPLVSLDKDTCKYTTCPLKSGDTHTYTVDVPIESKFPINSYTIKWTFTAPDGKQCCVAHDIKVIR